MNYSTRILNILFYAISYPIQMKLKEIQLYKFSSTNTRENRYDMTSMIMI